MGKWDNPTHTRWHGYPRIERKAIRKAAGATNAFLAMKA